MKPIFITGLYRSGTTLISRMLNNHSQLAVTYDSVHFMRFSYGKYDPISTAKNYRSLVLEIKERIEKRWNMHLEEQSVLKKLEAKKRIEYADVYDALMTTLLLKGSGKKRWGEKTNVCWGKIPAFLDMFPQGKVIHIIRDPRDVLVSFKHFTEETGLKYLDARIQRFDRIGVNEIHKIIFI